MPPGVRDAESLTKNAMARLSADQNGLVAKPVPASGRAVAEMSEWTHSLGSPSDIAT
jgi:hypothetical protein